MPETVEILRERILPLPSLPGSEQRLVAVTYKAENLPPRIVYIPEGQDAPEERVRRIAEDLKAARGQAPATLDIS